MKKLLSVENLEVRYGAIAALKGISLELSKGELVSVIGSNGAGKTSLLKCLSGLVAPVSGKIWFKEKEIQGWPAHKVAGLRMAHSPEGRKIFAVQTVDDNLTLGAYLRRWKESSSVIEKERDRIFEIFPILRERRKQQAGTLSGGQQQMLALGRALMAGPELLLLDEPSMGLAPVIIDELFKAIEKLHATGEVTILLVEQLAYRALRAADRAYVLEQGEVRLQGAGRDLLGSPEIQKAYLGSSS